MTRTATDSAALVSPVGRARSAPTRAAKERLERLGEIDLHGLLRGRKLVVIGGTGFLGKVWWVMLLAHFPEVERIYLVVRPRKTQTAQERFASEIATSECLEPLRQQHGDKFPEFLKQKVVPVAGDVTLPFCGLEQELRDELRDDVDAVVNAAGVVDFDPPLDQALDVNAFGVQNLVELCKDLGPTRLMHTSTCFVAGDRVGFIEELHPAEVPFPKAGHLEAAHWDPNREIDECIDVIEQAKHRAGDAFRQSHFLDQAKKNLEGRNEPARGPALKDEIEKVRRKFIEAQLAQMGTERAKFWGWPNTYTYTKSIGEQIICASGLDFTIARPAIIESSCWFPLKGWNEGINTSAPIIYALREGQPQIPGSDHALDVIPCDMCAGAMILSLAELFEGTAPKVYQYGTSDTNPITMRRMFELSGLYKRKYYKRTGRGGPVMSEVRARFEGSLLLEDEFRAYGPTVVAKGLKGLSKLLKSASIGPVGAITKPLAKAAYGFATQQEKVGSVMWQFVPFMATYDYTFRCDNTRAAYARVKDEDKIKIYWEPESIDWREWFFDVHCMGLEKWVWPLLDEKMKKERKAPRRHETLTEMLHEMASRYELKVALQRTEEHGLSRLSFSEWEQRSIACARRLSALGVGKGDRVLLAASNHPGWPISFFGILLAGGTVVPLDATIEADAAANLARASRAKVFISDDEVRERTRPAIDHSPEVELEWLGLLDAMERPDGQLDATGPWLAERAPAAEDVAALIYTSGTTGSPKGVMLSHENLTALVASLAPLFPLKKGDRVLSVLPLHHTFELTCGLLLPLSRGARIVYLDELNADRLDVGLTEGRITALIGVPALWEMIERRLYSRIAEHGELASKIFDIAVDVNRGLGKSLGVDAGRALFGPVHEALGGHLRFLVSGGAALPESTHNLFSGIGLHLAEGYGLTEAAPVLTVAKAGPKTRPGHVGKAVPGVEIRIHEPNEAGVGEVIARGPNVMLGYAEDEEATKQTIDSDGWLHTGDLGQLDKKGQLTIVGRAKDTIVSSNGENVYPDDVEARIGSVRHIEELTILGMDDPRGGERIACVAVCAEDSTLDPDRRRARAKKSLDTALNQLPATMRPAHVTLIDSPLPRTATRKVKRREVRRLIERVGPLSERPPRVDAPASSDGQGDGASQMVRSAVAVISRRSPKELTPELSLRGDLGFDSLMLLELLVALEGQLGKTVDADKLNDCHTIGDTETLLRQTAQVRRESATAGIERVDGDEPAELDIPEPLREAAMHWMGRGQMSFYDRVLNVTVKGRAFIPYNRNVMVAANHTSHLDMGLVKYGLGSYGQDMVSLAATDYFFEPGTWRKAYFEQMTNLAPMSRTGSLRQSLRQVGNIISQGKTVLIFPEGTRSVDGELHEFKPALGHLALSNGVDILPLYLGGAFRALPKGAAVLKSRKVSVHIGPPLTVSELRRLTAGMSTTEASRAVARLSQRAVEALSRGQVLLTEDLEPGDISANKAVKLTMATLFSELEARFQKGAVEAPISFYFTLGDGERWNIQATPESCVVGTGKPDQSADCVLKTSQGMFTRIVRDHYTPTPQEFIAGTIKSNNINLLVTFQQLFALAEYQGNLKNDPGTSA